MTDSDYSPQFRMTESSVWATIPVNSSLCEIRLLTLHAGAWDAHIRCSLQVVSLKDRPKYDALSYSWGKDKTELEISVDNSLVI